MTAVSRNLEKFPDGYVITLSDKEKSEVALGPKSGLMNRPLVFMFHYESTFSCSLTVMGRDAINVLKQHSGSAEI